MKHTDMMHDTTNDSCIPGKMYCNQNKRRKKYTANAQLIVVVAPIAFYLFYGPNHTFQFLCIEKKNVSAFSFGYLFVSKTIVMDIDLHPIQISSEK